MHVQRLMAAVGLWLALPLPATAQTEEEASQARAKLHLELDRHPHSWKKTSDDELQALGSGLRCSVALSDFLLTSISTLSFVSASQQGVMCEWTRSADKAGVIVAALEAGSYSLRDVTQMSTKASSLGGARPEVVPVEISYNGCPATRFDLVEGDRFKSQMTIVSKGGYFWTLAARGQLPVADKETELAQEDVFELADDYLRPQLTCEPLG